MRDGGDDADREHHETDRQEADRSRVRADIADRRGRGRHEEKRREEEEEHDLGLELESWDARDPPDGHAGHHHEDGIWDVDAARERGEPGDRRHQPQDQLDLAHARTVAPDAGDAPPGVRAHLV